MSGRRHFSKPVRIQLGFFDGGLRQWIREQRCQWRVLPEELPKMHPLFWSYDAENLFVFRGSSGSARPAPWSKDRG
jgi:hypothetical protein